MFAFFLTSMLLSCGKSDIGLTKNATCDGEQNGDEVTVDSVFDADGDGFFDANNPDCQAIYDPDVLDCNDADETVNPAAAEVDCDGIDNDCNEESVDAIDSDVDGFASCEDCDDNNTDVYPGAAEILCNGRDDDCDPLTGDGDDLDNDGWDECEDCDDANTEVNPGRTEVECNGRDDDCSDDTPDAVDADSDGFSVCDDDCDDNDFTRYPGNAEVCDDGIDNNCDGEIDESCDYTGTYFLDDPISSQCAWGLVNINVSYVQIFQSGSNITIGTTGSQPGTASGYVYEEDGSEKFYAQNILSGTCTETYTWEGSFLDSATASGTLTVEFTGGSACFDCTNFFEIFSATRY